MSTKYTLHLDYSYVEGSSAKIKYSQKLVSDDTYKSLNRECEITGQFSDRHKVRWVKSLFLQKIFLASEKISNIFTILYKYFFTQFCNFFNSYNIK